MSGGGGGGAGRLKGVRQNSQRTDPGGLGQPQEGQVTELGEAGGIAAGRGGEEEGGSGVMRNLSAREPWMSLVCSKS